MGGGILAHRAPRGVMRLLDTCFNRTAGPSANVVELLNPNLTLSVITLPATMRVATGLVDLFAYLSRKRLMLLDFHSFQFAFDETLRTWKLVDLDSRTLRASPTPRYSKKNCNAKSCSFRSRCI